MFHGTFTALVTPFTDEDAIDLAALEALVESQFSGGVQGIVAVGTTGESPTLTHKEREEVIFRTVQFAAGRCQVLAGTGSYSTREAVAQTRNAEKLGADGVLVVAPYYNKPSQEGLFRHFQEIAASTALPVMLYNIPGRCAVDITADTVVRLAEKCSNIVAIKEASGSVDRVSELRARLPRQFSILSGDDSLTLPFLAVGAVGVVSVACNIFPDEVRALVDCFKSGDVERAREMHLQLLGIFKDLFCEPNPVPVKTILAWQGRMNGKCRLPLCEMAPANEKRLRATLDAFERSR